MDSSSSEPVILPAHKGKATRRSWPQLPEELIRLIATYYIHDLQFKSYLPAQWDNRKFWHNRMAYSVLRDSVNLERYFMGVCPEWHRAVLTHGFWNQALAIVDPHEGFSQFLLRSVPSSAFITPFHQFRHILLRSCVVCRINFPGTAIGLGSGEFTLECRHLGLIRVCRDHHEQRTNWCQLCLRSGPIRRTQRQPISLVDQETFSNLGCAENEDDEYWPRVETTCRQCRHEAVLRRASHSEKDRLAVGGDLLNAADWETRHIIEMFVEHGDGTISDVISTAREKYWLRTNTKYESLGEHALAAQQSSSPREEEDEEEDDDPELLLMRDASQVRELALNDWARQRILDGFWVTPADSWYRHFVSGHTPIIPAIHPCPWAREVVPSTSPTSSGDIQEAPSPQEEEPRPLASTVTSEVPPTFGLCELAYGAHIRQLREILTPPMRNVVRKIVMESSIPTEKGFEDPAVKAAKMTLEDVLVILREQEGVWYDGVDWLERKRNEMDTLRRQRLVEAARKEDDILSTSSSSSGSDGSLKTSSGGGSTVTSPVLSTSTLQTTPSPPPSSGDEAGGAVKETETTLEQRYPSKASTLPVSPVRATPILLSSIPYLPLSAAALPPFCTEALKQIWRDACAPLYHCRCTICERAKLAQVQAQAKANPAYQPTVSPVVPSQPPPQYTDVTTVRTEKPANEIALKEASDIELDPEQDAEAEFDYDGLDCEFYDPLDDEIEEDEDDVDSRYEDDGEDHLDDNENENDGSRYSTSPEVDPSRTAPLVQRSRKRSSHELDDQMEEVEDDDHLSDLSASVSSGAGRTWRRDAREAGGGTPPKRARTGDSLLSLDEDMSTSGVETVSTVTTTSTTTGGVTSSPNSPRRQRKRSSEELDDDVISSPSAVNKRVRVNTAGGRITIGLLNYEATPSVTESVVESPVSTHSDQDWVAEGGDAATGGDGLVASHDAIPRDGVSLEVPSSPIPLAATPPPTLNAIECVD